MKSNSISWLNRVLCIALLGLAVACSEDPKPRQSQPDEPAPESAPAAAPEKEAPPKLKTPEFDGKSAYDFVQKQVDFGPRVPGTPEHLACAAYLQETLEGFDFDVIVQAGKVQAYTGDSLPIRNIIGQYAPELKERVMLFAHWDTRPFADRDNKKMGKPILGANDGGSGVGVLLEIARAISSDSVKPRIGVDIIFFDAEDYGQPSQSSFKRQASTWCLGTQYWAKNPPIPNYKPRYGILLDMVGAKGAEFPREGVSLFYAPWIVDKVWKTGQELGYGQFFIDEEFGEIVDDHRFVNTMTGIPSIDIIQYDVDRGDFGPFHHRHSDNMDIMSENTLKAVGHTVLEVIYSEY